MAIIFFLPTEVMCIMFKHFSGKLKMKLTYMTAVSPHGILKQQPVQKI